MAIEWDYQDRGVPRGPVNGQQLKDLAGQGVVIPSTPVRKRADDVYSPWARAGEVKGLFAGDVSTMLGDPICGQCGKLLAGGRCLACTAVLLTPPPPPMESVRAASPPMSAVQSGRKRYPHLTRYLDLLRLFAAIGLACGLAAAIVMFLVAASRHSDAGFVGGAFMAVVTAAIAGLSYLAALASIELINVILDIEAGVRQIEENTRPH